MHTQKSAAADYLLSPAPVEIWTCQNRLIEQAFVSLISAISEIRHPMDTGLNLLWRVDLNSVSLLFVVLSFQITWNLQYNMYLTNVHRKKASSKRYCLRAFLWEVITVLRVIQYSDNTRCSLPEIARVLPTSVCEYLHILQSIPFSLALHCFHIERGFSLNLFHFSFLQCLIFKLHLLSKSWSL